LYLFGYSRKNSSVHSQLFQKISKPLLVLSGEDVKSGVLASQDKCGMERRFTVEAKTFFFLTKAS
jgi:hypothetical protein